MVKDTKKWSEMWRVWAWGMSNSWLNSQVNAPTKRDCIKMCSSMFSLGGEGYKCERESALVFWDLGDMRGRSEIRPKKKKQRSACFSLVVWQHWYIQGWGVNQIVFNVHNDELAHHVSEDIDETLEHPTHAREPIWHYAVLNVDRGDS